MNSTLLIKNCGQILTMRGVFPKRGKQMSDLGIVKDGFILCQGNRISVVGKMNSLRKNMITRHTKVLDAKGHVVMPGLIDSHTHLVFAGNRADEWKQKLEGKSYLEILRKGGGILSTVRKTRQAKKEELLKNTLKHLDDMMRMGITTVEAKSGYGLDLLTELKILAVLKDAKKKSPVRIVPTFLGAHAVPEEFRGKAKAYLRFLKTTVLPRIKGLVSFVDIFCEKNAFGIEESREYLAFAKQLGFQLKIHGEQMNRLGACVMAAKLGAVSVDHGDKLSKRDITELAKTSTIVSLLPLPSLFLRERNLAPGRALIDAGVPIALATDFNPGSCPSKNLFLAMTMACVSMGLTIEEVLTATTINAACALCLGHEIGSIEAQKFADIIIMNVSDYREIPYWFGQNVTETVIIEGKIRM